MGSGLFQVISFKFPSSDHVDFKLKSKFLQAMIRNLVNTYIIDFSTPDTYLVLSNYTLYHQYTHADD
jgi:hypothetical protein